MSKAGVSPVSQAWAAAQAIDVAGLRRHPDGVLRQALGIARSSVKRTGGAGGYDEVVDAIERVLAERRNQHPI